MVPSVAYEKYSLMLLCHVNILDTFHCVHGECLPLDLKLTATFASPVPHHPDLMLHTIRGGLKWNGPTL